MGSLLSPFLAAIILCLVPLHAHAGQYAVARTATPVLNSPALAGLFGGHDGRTLKSDRCGQVREMEFVALGGTVFRVLAEVRREGATIFRVETDDYPAPPGIALYVDSRFMELRDQPPPLPVRPLPDRDAIIAAMRSSVGSPYVWGGNVRDGAPELLRLYYRGSFSPAEERRLTLAGLDCSGLLYAATNGRTPRNTSHLVHFGRGLAVAGKDERELAQLLEPLDLIVWNGHVIIVLDRETVIESRLECGRPGQGGVVITPLHRRLREIMAGRRPLDSWPVGSSRRDGFVVRRWYGVEQ
jgi:hypothetical protein